MVDVGDRLSRMAIREAIDNAQLELGLAVDYEDYVHLVFLHLGPSSKLAAIRRELANTIDAT